MEADGEIDKMGQTAFQLLSHTVECFCFSEISGVRGYVSIQLSLNLPLVTTQHLLNCKDPYIQEFMC